MRETKEAAARLRATDEIKAERDELEAIVRALDNCKEFHEVLKVDDAAHEWVSKHPEVRE